MIDHKYKCIFIHIPRCGGTSIENAIQDTPDYGDNFRYKHLTTAYAKILYEEYWNDYFKFSFVRNPWARMISMCKFPGIYGCRIIDSKIDVDDYLNTFPVIELDPRTDCHIDNHTVIHQNSVYKNILSDNINFIGRYENLQEDFNTICDKIGIPQQQLPHYTPSNHKQYTKYYDDETRELVAKKYAIDIEHFGYKFGE
jgi:hypothetical protein